MRIAYEKQFYLKFPHNYLTLNLKKSFHVVYNNWFFAYPKAFCLKSSLLMSDLYCLHI